MACNATYGSDECFKKSMKRRTVNVQRHEAQLPPFAVWRARHLRSRDLLFAVIATVVVLNYVRVTAPVICAYHSTGQQRYSLPEQQAQLVWDAVCGSRATSRPPSSQLLDGNNTALQEDSLEVLAATAGSLPAADASVGLLRHLLQAVVSFFLLCLVSPDPFHIIMPPLRTSFLLLLLAPLPLPNLPALWRAATKKSRTVRHSNADLGTNSPTGRKLNTTTVSGRTSKSSSSSSSTLDQHARTSARYFDGSSSSNAESASLIVWYSPKFYWQYPQLRYCIIILQRILPLVAAALGVGRARNPYFEFTLGVFCWRMLRKYVYDGWMQYMLVLPLPLHMAISACEFLLVYTTTLRVDAIYYSHANVIWYKVFHFAASVLFMLLLPTLGVARLERLQRQLYTQLQPAQPQQEHSQATEATEPPVAAVGCRTSTRETKNCCSGSDSSDAKTAMLSEASILTATGSSGSMAKLTAAARSTGNVTAELLLDGGHLAAGGSGASNNVSVQSETCDKSAVSSSLESAACASPAGASSDWSSRSTDLTHITTAGIEPDTARGSSSSATSSKHQKMDKRRKRSAELFLDHIESSAYHSTAAAATISTAASGLDTRDLAPVGTGQAVTVTTSSSSSSSSFLSGLMPHVSNIIGEDAAAAVFLAAAAAAASSHAGPKPGAMPFYTSLAQCLPASIKVHTSHSNYTALAPVLTSSLATGLGSLNRAMFPMCVESACFAGCVQLLANIIIMKSSKEDVNKGEKGDCTIPRDPGSMASALLSAVWDSLHAVKLLGHQDSLFAEPVHINRQDFDSAYGNALLGGDADAAKVGACKIGPVDLDSSPAWSLGFSGPDSKARLADTQPGIGVSVGTSVVGSFKPTLAGDKPPSSVITASSSMCYPSVVLRYPQPACLVARTAQLLTLQLQLSAGDAAAAAVDRVMCRLLVYQSGCVLLDEPVVLQNAVSVSLPALQPGIINVALLPTDTQLPSTALPSVPPATAAAHALEAASSALDLYCKPMSPNNAAAAAAAPLLLCPLLVLPAPAAQELQQHWQQAAAAADSSTAWQECIAPLATDLSYLLASCKATSHKPQMVEPADAVRDNVHEAGPASVPEGVRAVLSQLLQHLAACGMWATLQVVVQTASEAYVRV